MKTAGRHLLPMLLGCALLSGCGMAEFESPPGEQLASCDPQFVGHWRLDGADKAGERPAIDPVYVTVAPGCSGYRLLGKERVETVKSNQMPVFARVGERSILALPMGDPKTSDPALPRWKRQAYVYFAYEKQGARLHLYPVKDTTAARLIIDDGVAGRVNVVSGVGPQEYQPLSVYIIGTPAQMVAVVQSPDLFDQQPLSLVPVAASELPALKSSKPHD